MSDQHSRTEKATAQKRDKARQRGQVFRSREVAGAASFLAAAGGVTWLGERAGAELMESTSYFLTTFALPSAEPAELTAEALRRATLIGAPFMGLAVAAGVLGSFVQAPPVFSFEPFAPNPSRLFSMSKLTNMVSSSGLANVVRGVLGLASLLAVGYFVLSPLVPEMARLTTMTSVQMSSWVGEVVLKLLWRSAVVFGLIAAADYVLNRHQFEQNLKMTKQEVKDEHKQLEGDPQIKARVRRVQRAAARRRMMAAVARATVVVVNPTHVAVALQYDSVKVPAPRVVAKGKGELALRIREVARKNGVAIYEDPPLARALYDVELDQTIPAELFKAVAEVLAHLVRATGLRF